MGQKGIGHIYGKLGDSWGIMPQNLASHERIQRRGQRDTHSHTCELWLFCQLPSNMSMSGMVGIIHVPEHMVKEASGGGHLSQSHRMSGRVCAHAAV